MFQFLEIYLIRHAMLWMFATLMRVSVVGQMAQQWSVSGLTVVNFVLGGRQQVQAKPRQEFREVTRVEGSFDELRPHRFDNA